MLFAIGNKNKLEKPLWLVWTVVVASIADPDVVVNEVVLNSAIGLLFQSTPPIGPLSSLATA